MPIVEFTITVTYPPNADECDFEDMLHELLECASKYGLGVDGDYIIDPILLDEQLNEVLNDMFRGNKDEE